MRFALMIEPQQGLSYDEQLAIVRRAEAAGFEAFFRSDHYQSFPGPAGSPTTDAWAVLGRPGPRDRRGSGSATLVSPVTFRHARQPREGRHDRRRDERRPDRVRPRRRLERRRARPARAAVPGDRRAGRHARGAARGRCYGLWGEPDGWSFEGSHVQIRDAQFHPKPVDAPGRPTLPNGASRPRILVGGGGTPRSMRIAARYADEFNLSSSSPDVARTKYAPARGGLRGDRPRSRRRSPARRWSGVLIGRDRAELGARQQRAAPRLRQRRRGRGLVPRAARPLDLRHAGRGPGAGRAVRRGRSGADHAPGLPAARPRHGRPDGGDASF